VSDVSDVSDAVFRHTVQQPRSNSKMYRSFSANSFKLVCLWTFPLRLCHHIVSVLLLDIGVIRAQSIGCCACSRMCLTVHVYVFRRSKMPGGKNKKKQHFKRHVYPREKTKEVNQFELKVNRQKHEVLGRKVSKTDKGMPGVSRSKAIKKVC